MGAEFDDISNIKISNVSLRQNCHLYAIVAGNAANELSIFVIGAIDIDDNRFVSLFATTKANDRCSSFRVIGFDSF